MLFVWTSEGGPLQYIGLGLFLLQVLPQVLPDIQRNISNETAKGFAVGLAVGLFSMVLWKLRNVNFTVVRQRLGERIQQVRRTIVPPQQQPQQQQGEQQQQQGQPQPQPRGQPQQRGQPPPQPRGWSYYAVPCLLSILLGCAIFTMAASSSSASTTSGTTTTLTAVDLLRWLPYLGQLVTILSVLGFGRAGGQFPPYHHHYHPDPTARRAKLEQVTALVRNIPLEPFVPEEDMATLPISQLKQMLQRRGVSEEEFEMNSFVERQDLVEALRKRRKYSDTCCICYEDLNRDEPMRILPNCYHEIHVECLDKWVYTFANNPIKLRQEPTCPLCKKGMTNEKMKKK